MSPSSMARTAAWVRSETSSFLMIRSTWTLAVDRLIVRVCAIFGLDWRLERWIFAPLWLGRGLRLLLPLFVGQTSKEPRSKLLVQGGFAPHRPVDGVDQSVSGGSFEDVSSGARAQRLE